MDRLALTLKQTATGSGNFTKLVLHYEKIANAIFWVKSQFATLACYNSKFISKLC